MTPSRLAAASIVVGCLFFAYGFLLRVSPSVMVAELMRDFAVSAAILGNLSAVYLYAYGALQIPIGVLLDRLGPRRLVTAACLVVAAGAAIFAAGDNIHTAYIGRFLIGVGAAFSWPGLLAVIHRWYPSRFGLLTGVGQFTGMTGAAFAQAPLAAAVGAVGWNDTMLALAAAGVVIALLLWVVTRDRPHVGAGRLAVASSLRQVLANGQTWLSAAFGLAMTGPILTYGGLWGVPYLSAVYGYESTVAAGLVSLVFVGAGVGGMVLGGWSDRLGRRKPIMLMGSLLCLSVMTIVIYVPDLSKIAIATANFLIGLGGCSLMFSFAMGREHNVSAVTGIAIGVVNTAVIGSAALLQPLIGVLLDWQWAGAVADGVRIYSAADYRFALGAVPLVGLIALVALLFLKETYCRQRK